jgi:hypothetical protein
LSAAENTPSELSVAFNSASTVFSAAFTWAFISATAACLPVPSVRAASRARFSF